MIPEKLQQSKQKIAEICRKYGIRELTLFGSRAKGDYKPNSDYDILIEFKPQVEIGLIQFLKIQSELEEIVENQVDLVSKKGLKSAIRESVLSKVEIIYAEF